MPYPGYGAGGKREAALLAAARVVPPRGSVEGGGEGLNALSEALPGLKCERYAS